MRVLQQIITGLLEIEAKEMETVIAVFQTAYLSLVLYHMLLESQELIK